MHRIAGVDEAGRGPWAGPVVAAAVILHSAPLPVRVDDSKRLTPRQRTHAFDVIRAHAEVGFGIVCAEEIDRRNILRATLLAMQEAILDLPRTPDLVLVDGTMVPSVAMPCRPIVHGDQRHYVISCASIMAKVLRDRLMDFYHELDPRYAFNQHKGYGTALHTLRLKDYGPSLWHRRSFRPVMAAYSSTVSFGVAGPAAGPPHGRPRPATIAPVLRADVGALAPRHPPPQHEMVGP